MERQLDLLQVGFNLGFRAHMLRLCRHIEVGLGTDLRDGRGYGFGCFGTLEDLLWVARMWDVG